MTLSHPLLSTLLAALPLWAPTLHAQTPTAPASATAPAGKSTSRREQQALEWFRMLDANKDGRISRDEGKRLLKFKPSLAEDFKEADLNGDGYLTQQEIRATADRRRAEREERRRREAQAEAAAAGAMPVTARAAAPKARPAASAAKAQTKPGTAPQS